MDIQTIRHESVGETLQSASLSNGLRVRVVPKKGFSSYFACFGTYYGSAMRSFLLSGERHDTPAGVAHYLEHKMFDMPDGDNALQTMTASGADPNAFTSYDETVYYFRCTENFEENLRTLLRFVSTPYFTAETVAKEQGIIAQEIRMYDDEPDNAVYYELMRLLYRSHPVRDDIAGTVESIAEINADTLLACHRAFYVPGNMCLCVEGDVDAAAVCAIAEEVLGSESGEKPQPLIVEENDAPAALFTERRMSVAAPLFLLGAAFRPTDGDVLRERIVARLALRLLCGASSPFYARLYREGLINRSFAAGTDFPANTAVVTAGGESRDPQRVFDELLGEVSRIGEEGFEKDYFERARRASLGARLRGFEDFDSVCLSCFEAAALGYDVFDAPAVLASVTAEECRDFLVRTLTRERTALSVVRPIEE
ncbi:MAG: insulinase family protein [Oscillospiraceae bacterium]|nr:insulinase family protein [Oscillospiraceae bacterium]